MDSIVLTHRNLYWRVKEFMTALGIQNYSVTTKYPTQNEVDTFTLPIICVNVNAGTNIDIELGASPNFMLNCVLDIFATGNLQIDGIIGGLLNYFKSDSKYTLYDMSVQEPSVIGDYSSLLSIGNFFIGAPYWRKYDVTNQEDKRFLYQGFISFNVELPSIS